MAKIRILGNGRPITNQTMRQVVDVAIGAINLTASEIEQLNASDDAIVPDNELILAVDGTLTNAEDYNINLKALQTGINAYAQSNDQALTTKQDKLQDTGDVIVESDLSLKLSDAKQEELDAKALRSDLGDVTDLTAINPAWTNVVAAVKGLQTGEDIDSPDNSIKIQGTHLTVNTEVIASKVSVDTLNTALQTVDSGVSANTTAISAISTSIGSVALPDSAVSLTDAIDKT